MPTLVVGMWEARQNAAWHPILMTFAIAWAY